MNRKIFKGFVFCGILVFTISACATVKNFAGFFGFMNSSGKKGTEKNITTFAKTLRPARGNPDSHFMLARYYQDRGNHVEAIIEFEKTIAIDPENAKALNAMGVSYDNLKQYGRATDCYQAALRLDPESANIYYNNIGQSLLLEGKYIPAIEAFKKAAAYDEDFPDARIHNNLGRAYAMAGQYDLALVEFEKVNGSASAEAILDRVLLADGQSPGSGAVAITAGDGAKDFTARVSRFLQERHEAAHAGSQTVPSVIEPQKPSPQELAAEICVEVSNGNGAEFTARNMRDALIQKGFRVTRVTNGINVQRTYIYYEKGHAEEAKVLAGQMPVVAKLKEVAGLEVPDIKIKILLGRDMIRHMRKPLQNQAPLNHWIGA